MFDSEGLDTRQNCLGIRVASVSILMYIIRAVLIDHIEAVIRLGLGKFLFKEGSVVIQ